MMISGYAIASIAITAASVGLLSNRFERVGTIAKPISAPKAAEVVIAANCSGVEPPKIGVHVERNRLSEPDSGCRDKYDCGEHHERLVADHVAEVSDRT